VAAHCEHWRDGDGSCCRCGEPNWCPDDGEDEAALQQHRERENSCTSTATVPGMNDLVVWLRQQLDADDRAVAAILRRDPTWRVDPEPWPNGVGVLDEKGDGVAIANGSYAAEFIALHDPARELREVEAKRLIIDLHLNAGQYPLAASDECRECVSDHPCPTLRLLALPYSDREGYREGWKP
jgi:hypothetical protein